MNEEIVASVTERGQVTIPAKVRKALGLKPRDTVTFVLKDDVVTLKKPNFTLRSVGGSVPPLKKKLEWREMMEIAHEDLVEEITRKSARE